MAIDYEQVKNLRSEDQEFRYSDRDTMLYALGIGMGADPADPRELPFVFENGLKAMPTQATVIPWGAGRIFETGINFLMVVHSEQRLVMHRPLPPEGVMLADWRIADLLDKGSKGAVLNCETVLKDKATGEKVATLTMGVFARGDGGFGGPTEGGPPAHEIPTRAPDAEVALATRPDQALLYRLSGDRNPLHADPNFAKAAGFPRPILHGLCSYGIAARAVLQTYCDYDPARIRAFDARFSAPVIPGETLLIRLWKDGDVVSFEGAVKERDVIALKNGRALIGAPLSGDEA